MNRPHILNGPIANLYLAPDIDTGGGVAIPVVQHAPSTKVTDVQLDNAPAIENSPAVKVAKPGGLKGPQDFGEESAADSQERMGLGKESNRGKDGRFLPKGQKEAAKPAPKAGEKPAEPAPQTGPPKATPVAQKPAAAKPVPIQTAPVEQPPVAKVKLGDKEFTPEEIAKQIADRDKELTDLRAKAAKPTEPVLPKEPEKPEPTKEEAAAQYKAREDKWIAENAPRYAIPPQEWDRILADPKGGEVMGTKLALAEMRGRQYSADQTRQVYAELDALREEFAPILESHGQVSRLMEEHAILAANPELKDHPKGAETFRKINAEMRDGRAAIEQKITAGTASGTERGWALQYDDMTPQQRNEAAATHAKAELVKLPAEQVQPKPTNPPKLTVVEKPLNADRPGGSSVTRTETAEQRLVRETMAASGVG